MFEYYLQESSRLQQIRLQLNSHQYGTQSLLVFALVCHHTHSVLINPLFLAGLQFPVAAHTSRAYLRFGLWPTLRTIKDFTYLLTYYLYGLHVVPVTVHNQCWNGRRFSSRNYPPSTSTFQKSLFFKHFYLHSFVTVRYRSYCCVTAVLVCYSRQRSVSSYIVTFVSHTQYDRLTQQQLSFLLFILFRQFSVLSTCYYFNARQYALVHYSCGIVSL